MKVPIRLTGTASVGISVARTLPRNRNTTSTTRMKASISVFCTSWIVSVTNDGRVVGDLPGEVLGEALLAVRSSFAAPRSSVAIALAPGA